MLVLYTFKPSIRNFFEHSVFSLNRDKNTMTVKRFWNLEHNPDLQ